MPRTDELQAASDVVSAQVASITGVGRSDAAARTIAWFPPAASPRAVQLPIDGGFMAIRPLMRCIDFHLCAIPSRSVIFL